MPRASSNPELATSGGGGVEPGSYEVTAATFVAHKTDHKPTHLALALTMQILGKDDKQVRGADPVELFLSYGTKSIENFRPGKAKNADDDDPKDLGGDPGTEGNTIYCDGKGEVFHRSTAAMVFFDSLSKHGFPKSVLARSYALDFKGLKFELAKATSKECNDVFGTRLSTKGIKNEQSGQMEDVNYTIAKKWLNPSYLKGGAAKDESSNSEQSKSDTKSEAKTESSAKSDAGGDINELISSTLLELAKTKGGDANKIKNVAQLVGFFTNAFTKAGKPKAQLGACQAALKVSDTLSEILGEIGGYIEDDGFIVLPG